MTGTWGIADRIPRTWIEGWRANLFLGGLVAFGVMVGMAVAHHELAMAGLVGWREGAEVLAVPGFGFGVLGAVMIGVPVAHALYERWSA